MSSSLQYGLKRRRRGRRRGRRQSSVGHAYEEWNIKAIIPASSPKGGSGSGFGKWSLPVLRMSVSALSDDSACFTAMTSPSSRNRPRRLRHTQVARPGVNAATLCGRTQHDRRRRVMEGWTNKPNPPAENGRYTRRRGRCLATEGRRTSRDEADRGVLDSVEPDVDIGRHESCSSHPNGRLQSRASTVHAC